MNVETVSELEDLVIRRLVLEPGEATPWHVDPCRRFTVVVRGSLLRIEFGDGATPDAEVSVRPGLVGWDNPEPRPHRAVNAGPDTYEEVVSFYRHGNDTEVQPGTSR